MGKPVFSSVVEKCFSSLISTFITHVCALEDGVWRENLVTLWVTHARTHTRVMMICKVCHKHGVMELAGLAGFQGGLKLLPLSCLYVLYICTFCTREYSSIGPFVFKRNFHPFAAMRPSLIPFSILR